VSASAGADLWRVDLAERERRAAGAGQPAALQQRWSDHVPSFTHSGWRTVFPWIKGIFSPRGY